MNSNNLISIQTKFKLIKQNLINLKLNFKFRIKFKIIIYELSNYTPTFDHKLNYKFNKLI